jgi:hypothetical protein
MVDTIQSPVDLAFSCIGLAISAWIAFDTRRALRLALWTHRDYVHSDRFVRNTKVIAWFVCAMQSVQLIIHFLSVERICGPG